MGCGSWDAAARRRWAKVARIGYAIRQARRNRARVPHLDDRQLQSADTSDSLQVESKFQADAVGVDTALPRWVPVTRLPLSLFSAFVGPPACAGSGPQCAVVPHLCSVRRLRTSGARESTWRKPARLGVWVAC